MLRLGDCFIIRDRLSSKESHTYDFCLHADGRLSLDGAGDASPSADSPSRWITDMSSHQASDTIRASWQWASQSLDLWMAGSGPITPMTAMCPAEDGTHRVPLLIARQTDTNAEFVTVLYPHRGRWEFGVERRGAELVIRRGGREDVVVLPEQGERPRVSSQLPAGNRLLDQ